MIRRVFPLLLLLLALVGCGMPTPGADRRAMGASTATPAPTVAVPARPTYSVERGEVVARLNFPGRIAPVVEQELLFPLDGVVKAVHVERGATVEAGEVLAELETGALEEELLRAQERLAIAEARLNTAQAELAANRRQAEIAVELAQLDLDLAREQAGAAPTSAQSHDIRRLELLLESAQVELDRLNQVLDPALQTEVDAATLEVQQLEATIASTRLLAPFAGQLLAFRLEPGRAVVAGEPVGVIADPSELEVTAGLQSSTLELLAENMPVEISPGSGPGGPYQGTIRQLPYGTAITDGEGEVRIRFDDPDVQAEFQAGQRVTLSAAVAESDDVLWLPPAAIRDFNGRKFVVVQEGEAQRRVDVTLGLEGPDRVEIVAGVDEGQTVIGP